MVPKSLSVPIADARPVKKSFWLASFDSISVNGAPVVESAAAIFDSGTTQIVGDPTGIGKLFEAIDGAQPAPQLGEGAYTSTFPIA